MKKALSIILTAVLMLTVVPFGLFGLTAAADEVTPSVDTVTDGNNTNYGLEGVFTNTGDTLANGAAIYEALEGTTGTIVINEDIQDFVFEFKYRDTFTGAKDPTPLTITMRDGNYKFLIHEWAGATIKSTTLRFNDKSSVIFGGNGRFEVADDVWTNFRIVMVGQRYAIYKNDILWTSGTLTDEATGGELALVIGNGYDKYVADVKLTPATNADICDVFDVSLGDATYDGYFGVVNTAGTPWTYDSTYGGLVLADHTWAEFGFATNIGYYVLSTDIRFPAVNQTRGVQIYSTSGYSYIFRHDHIEVRDASNTQVDILYHTTWNEAAANADGGYHNIEIRYFGGVEALYVDDEVVYTTVLNTELTAGTIKFKYMLANSDIISQKNVKLVSITSDSATIVDSTCTTNGSATVVCDICGETHTLVILANGHKYTSETTDATCDEKGKIVYTCSDCGDTYEEPIEAEGHNYVGVVTDPTCEDEGFTTYTCDKCGDSYVDDKVDALGHSYTSVKTDATCTEDGKIVYTCSTCGHTYEEVIHASGHSYEGTKIDAALDSELYDGFLNVKNTAGTFWKYDSTYGGLVLADHTWAAFNYAEEVGYYVFSTDIQFEAINQTRGIQINSTSGYSYRFYHDNVVIKNSNNETVKTIYYTSWNADGAYHNIKLAYIGGLEVLYIDGVRKYETILDTEVVLGAFKVTYMLNNGDMLSQKNLKLIAINDTNITKVDASCTVDGYISVGCDDCDANITEAITAKGHSYTSETFDPTCTEDGKIVYTCSDCGDTYEEPIEAEGHNYVGVVTDPTCEDEGFTTYTCDKCGDSYVDDKVDALGHSYTSVKTDATCTEDGKIVYTCSTCGHTYEEVIEAEGHNYVGVVTDPTCEDEGFTTYTCDKCGDSYVDDKVDALGHSYTSVKTDATCTEDGKIVYTCSTCGHTYEEIIEAEGHNEVIDAAVEETCGTTGLTEGKHCDVCGEVLVKQEVIAATGNHVYGDWVIVDATVDAAGSKTKTCNCGDTIVEVIPRVLKLRSYTLAIPSNISFVYRIDSYYATECGYENLRIKFTLGDKTLLVDEYTINPENGSYEFYFNNIAPQQMTDVMYATIYAENQGVTYSVDCNPYSVVTYATNQLGRYADDSNYAKFCTFIVDLLYYGEAAQNHNRYNTENLATSVLTDSWKAFASTAKPTANTVKNNSYVTIDNPTAAFKTITLELENSIAVRYGFEIPADVSIDRVTLKFEFLGGEWTYAAEDFKLTKNSSGGDRYIAVFNKLNPSQMKEEILCTILIDGVAASNTYRYSVESYAYGKLEEGNARAVLLNAMLTMGASAKAYVG